MLKPGEPLSLTVVSDFGAVLVIELEALEAHGDADRFLAAARDAILEAERELLTLRGA